MASPPQRRPAQFDPSAVYNLRHAVLEYDQNQALGAPNPSAELGRHLKDSQILALISAVLLSLGIAQYVSGQIANFLRGMRDSDSNWTYSIKKDQKVGADTLGQQGRTLLHLVNISQGRETLDKESINQLTELYDHPTIPQRFVYLLGTAVVNLEFHNAENLLFSMMDIVRFDPKVPTDKQTFPLSLTGRILREIMYAHIPSSLLDTFVNSVKRRNEALSQSSDRFLLGIKEILPKSHPIYQTSALIILGKHGLSPQNINIVANNMEPVINEAMATIITQCIQYYIRVLMSPTASPEPPKSPKPPAQLDTTEAAMLEKLIKNTKCYQPRPPKECKLIDSTINSLENQILSHLKEANLPHLSYKFRISDARAYETDLGIFALALRSGFLQTQSINDDALSTSTNYLRNMYNQGIKVTTPCGTGTAKAITLNQAWENSLEALGEHEKRGFARGLVYITASVPPYELPEIPFSDYTVPDAFDAYLRAYCAQKNQTPGATAIYLPITDPDSPAMS